VGEQGAEENIVTGGQRNLHNEELHNLHSSPSIIGVMKSMCVRWTGHVVGMGEEEYLQNFDEKSRPLGRPRRS
jgi:hypothetical protein